MTLTITTYDWVPEFPRGFVRDLRVRWACAEAGLPYRIETVPLHPKSAEHIARQPFGQVPILTDGPIELFESGAIVLYLAGKSEALMPADAAGRAEVLQWSLAALNSVEPFIFPWLLARLFQKDPEAEAKAAPLMHRRLGQLDAVLAGRAFIACGCFTAADILMADVLRQSGAHGALEAHPALRAYAARMTARPAFRQVHAEQRAAFAAADAARAAQAAE